MKTLDVYTRVLIKKAKKKKKYDEEVLKVIDFQTENKC